MRRLYIVRHGQTEWNVQNRMQGRLNSPLTELGQNQARVNGQLLKRLGGVDRLWSSPLGRTRQTADLINEYNNVDIDYADALMERDCGDWGGRIVSDITDEEWAARQADPYWHQPPGGENYEDMLVRVRGFLDGLQDSDWTSIGLVTHGVMAKVILKHFLDMSEADCVALRFPNDIVYRLTLGSEDIDTHHFVSGGEPRSGFLIRQADNQPHRRMGNN